MLAGIQVWLRFSGDAIINSMYHRKTGISRPLIQLMTAKREPLPYRCVFALPHVCMSLLKSVLAQAPCVHVFESVWEHECARRSSSAWWNVPGPEQPALNRTWEAFTPGYQSTNVPIADYVQAHTPQRFRHGELLGYVKRFAL